MDIAAWVLKLLTGLLARTGLPTWIVDGVLAAIAKALTPECLAHIEEHVKELICSQLRRLETANPNEFTKEVVDSLCSVIGCQA